MFNNPSNEETASFDKLIKQTDIELKRLGWTKEQGRDYLMQAYGKRSRLMLLDEELIEFLSYLKSLPTSGTSDRTSPSTTTQPFDKFSKQIDIELKRINWTEEQESQYLLQTYGKRSRFMLPDGELSEFVSYLKSLPRLGESDRASFSTTIQSTLSNRETESFDNLIEQTDIELKRLGWTKEKGRDYLLQAYGKRSRLMLLDGELKEFLHYLKAQP
ncbi:MAG: hypothetical protein MUD14_24220 [Hydrococcus sp. Prado102]|jgi:hypothetical protein|nr:hypothetical protein [Hydrococcus sp. Prado102]